MPARTGPPPADPALSWWLTLLVAMTSLSDGGLKISHTTVGAPTPPQPERRGTPSVAAPGTTTTPATAERQAARRCWEHEISDRTQDPECVQVTDASLPKPRSTDETAG